jgi:hypothetical protein
MVATHRPLVAPEALAEASGPARAGDSGHLHVVPAPSTLGQRPRPFHLMTDLEVEQLLPIEWLLHDMLPEGSVSVLYGRGGRGKSFLAVDWALCIAAGESWFGHPVKQGSVVYIAAEGARGLRTRMLAWKQHRNRSGCSLPLFVLPDAVQLLDADDQETLLHAVDDLHARPVLIVIDTLAKCTAGADENSGQEIGRALAAATIIARTTQAHILLVHHATKSDGSGPRGHSRLYDDVDTVLHLTRAHRGPITLHCEKQRDEEEFKNIVLRLQVVTLEEGDGETSCVLQLGGSPASEQWSAADRDDIERWGETATSKDPEVLEALTQCGVGGATSSTWQKAAGLSASTFKRAKRRLLQSGLVVASDARPKQGTKFSAVGV